MNFFAEQGTHEHINELDLNKNWKPIEWSSFYLIAVNKNGTTKKQKSFIGELWSSSTSPKNSPNELRARESSKHAPINSPSKLCEQTS